VLAESESGIALVSATISTRNAQRPRNLPTTISVTVTGALMSSTIVWLRRSSAIARIASSGTARSIRTAIAV
jgi:hypothetical protein